MLTKAKIKFLQSLQHKKFRQLYHRFVVDGDKTVRELVNSHFVIETIYAEPWWLNKFKSLVNSNTEVIEVSSAALQSISTLQSANGVVAIAEISMVNAAPSTENKLCIALDNINDPGNLGTIIRIADWFSIDTILCSETCVDSYNPKVVNAAKGSLFRTNIHYLNLESFFANNQPKVFGAMLDGENIFKAELSSTGVILIGSEAHGISNELQPFISHKITIPSFGNAESLNAGVATGIICAEFLKRTQQ
jgi:TrmH family RNA methyltransferase